MNMSSKSDPERSTDATVWTTIINGAAGGGRCRQLVGDEIERLRAQGMHLETHYTAWAGHAERLAREAWQKGARHFIAVGGDGTTFEVVNGIFPEALTECGSDERPVIGALPLGTGNSFLRDFEIDSAEAASRALLGGQTRPCDVARVTHSEGEIYFVNLLSLGFSAEAGELTNRRFKPLGYAGYGLAVLVTLARLTHPRFPMVFDGDGRRFDKKCTLVSFSNSRFTGGTMMMAPDALTDDGSLDFVYVPPLGRARFLRWFPNIYQGTHDQMPKFEHRRFQRVDFDLAGPVDLMVDGEVRRLELERIDVLPRALEVVA